MDKNFSHAEIFKIYFLCFSHSSIIGCDACMDRLCGEPGGRKKTFLDSINAKYKNDHIACPVSCYEDYIKIYLKVDYQSSLIESLEIRYRKSISHVEFLVYDKNKKLIRVFEGSM